VIVEVKTNADYFAGPRDRRAESFSFWEVGEFFVLLSQPSLEPCKAVGFEEDFVVIFPKGGGIQFQSLRR
jgi:hypothetical protein